MTPIDQLYLEDVQRLRQYLRSEYELETPSLVWAISKIRALEKENAEFRAILKG